MPFCGWFSRHSLITRYLLTDIILLKLNSESREMSRGKMDHFISATHRFSLDRHGIILNKWTLDLWRLFCRLSINLSPTSPRLFQLNLSRLLRPMQSIPWSQRSLWVVDGKPDPRDSFLAFVIRFLKWTEIRYRDGNSAKAPSRTTWLVAYTVHVPLLREL